MIIAWENSRHLATLPLVSPPNDVWETSAEIPYWWRVTTQDLGSASDWSCRVENLIQPIASTIQIWVVTRHQYGISALASQTSFGGETNDSVAKCWLFSQASMVSVKTESRNRRASFPKSSKRIHIESATEYYFKVCTYPLLCSKSHKWKTMSITRGVICENTCKSKRLPMYAVFLFNNLMFKTTLKVSGWLCQYYMQL